MSIEKHVRELRLKINESYQGISKKAISQLSSQELLSLADELEKLHEPLRRLEFDIMYLRGYRQGEKESNERENENVKNNS